jgi:hypothetical protein
MLSAVPPELYTLMVVRLSELTRATAVAVAGVGSSDVLKVLFPPRDLQQKTPATWPEYMTF